MEKDHRKKRFWTNLFKFTPFCDNNKGRKSAKNGRVVQRTFTKCGLVHFVFARISSAIVNLKLTAARVVARITKQYYVEDYSRVYPNGLVFDSLGKAREPSENDINNFRNHVKFYIFASQFVKDKKVADVGCGSGYGSKILIEKGSRVVYGCDASRHAIQFAQQSYGKYATFVCQSIVDLREYENEQVDVAIISEVLEHVKEYGMVDQAIVELKRITRKNGLIIIGTPNSELLGKHGFYFDEISSIMRHHFSKYLIFENALVPYLDKEKTLLEKRFRENRCGLIVSEKINLGEIVLAPGQIPELKKGIESGILKVEEFEIDTSLLHNTHSWVVLAKNEDS
ncbi:MAG: class I SAM-dependent methyltransferase [Candidatus Bathyarchaeia archaeon]